MEEEITPQPEVNHPANKPKNKNNFLIIILITLLFFAMGITAYAVYQNSQLKKQITKLRLTSTPNPVNLDLTPTVGKPMTGTTDTEAPKSTQPPLPTFTPNPTSDWKAYTHENIPEYAYWQGFTLYYPPSWELKLGESPPEYETLDLSLTKGDYRINIFQGPSGGGGCLYPEDPDKDGMYMRYGKYREITKNDGSIWRIAYPQNMSEEAPRLGVCSKLSNDNEFNGTTPAGTISIYVPRKTSEIPEEIYQILEKIKITL